MSIISILLLGVGLSMDACAVSISNGLANKKISIKETLLIALTFGIFQMMMPLIGYFIGSLFTNLIVKIVPYIALALLSFLGIKMIVESIKSRKKNEDEEEKEKEEENIKKLSFKMLLIQAIATSIDALSVGLVFVGINYPLVILYTGIIGIITTILSLISVFIGKKFGDIFSNKAEIVGGIILIAIGLKIFIESFL